jgi:RNA polymerase sigma-70 factor (ECF subfamily)
MSPPIDSETPRPGHPPGPGGRPPSGGRHGPDERFRGLFDRHSEEVFRFFVRRGLSTEDARDLTQVTFFRVYQGLEGFREDATERTWIFSVAHHAFLNTLRHESASKRKRDEIPIGDGGASDAPARSALSLADRSAPDPFESTLTRERREILRRAIDALPDRMRHCVLLWLDQDLKYREIADVLGVSIDTVKSQLHQAKQRLRRTVGNDFHGWDALGGPS